LIVTDANTKFLYWLIFNVQPTANPMRLFTLIATLSLLNTVQAASEAQALGFAQSKTSVRQPTNAAVTKVEEWTFIKANDGKRDAAVEFIKRNWFAMDEIAKQRGLMLDYELLTKADSDKPETNKSDWDIVVRVRYPNTDGYEAIAIEFEAIRRAHQTVLIDGKKLADLARIVRSERLLVR
jgi:hypothetical protein